MADRPPGGGPAHRVPAAPPGGLPPPIHPAWGGRPARPFRPQNWEPRFARLVYHLADVHDQPYLRMVEETVDRLQALHTELHGHPVSIEGHEQLLQHLHGEHT
ncbi:MAG TPA: hypothetical protein VHF25_10450 [Nitriliruptorales bacterium]|nr:hypothetical protein [Nitriliruptorales bacterium]